MPAWIHDRATDLKKKMKDTYGPEKAEQIAFAVATQQAHKVGKSPKTFVSKQTGKKESFGTPEGRREAKMKFDKPKSEYKKTAADKAMDTVLETNEKSVPGITQQPGATFDPVVVNDMADTLRAASDTDKAKDKDTALYFDGKTTDDLKQEKTIKDPMSENPGTPAIKVAMYGSFLREFTKIAMERIA
jgi:hypothetical protein